MASVTFPLPLGGDGSTVTDDADPVTGLAGGGHRDRFVPALSQTVAMAQTSVDKAAEASTTLSEFEKAYLGAFAADPLVDNEGNPLELGALYFHTSAPQEVRVYTSTGWVGIASYTTGNLFV